MHKVRFECRSSSEPDSDFDFHFTFEIVISPCSERVVQSHFVCAWFRNGNFVLKYFSTVGRTLRYKLKENPGSGLDLHSNLTLCTELHSVTLGDFTLRF